MAGDLGLALAQNLHQVADTNLAACNQIQQAQACGVGEGGKERNQGRRGGPGFHTSMIYGLTNMSRKEYIRFNTYEEGGK